MKNQLFYLCLIVLSVMACKPKVEEPVIPGDPASKPQWQAVINPEFPSSMTITCLPPSGETVTADDEVAAFWGDTCRAVAGQANGIFYMVINGPQTTVAMQVKYYSATYKTIRTAQITYTPEANIGSTDAPYRLDFSGAVATPKRITLTGVMPGKDAVQARKINIGNADGEGNLNLFWREGDQIRVQLYGGGSEQDLTISDGKNTRYGKFSWTGLENNNYVVTYPISATSANGCVTYTLPATQNYVKDNFADNLMPAHSNLDIDWTKDIAVFNFNPIASLVQLSLTSNKSISIKSIAISTSVNIAGTITTNGTTTTGGNSTSVTLNCGSGVALSNTATVFNIVLPSVTLPTDTKFTITDTNNQTYVKTTGKDFVLTQGEYYPIPVIDL